VRVLEAADRLGYLYDPEPSRHDFPGRRFREHYQRDSSYYDCWGELYADPPPHLQVWEVYCEEVRRRPLRHLRQVRRGARARGPPGGEGRGRWRALQAVAVGVGGAGATRLSGGDGGGPWRAVALPQRFHAGGQRAGRRRPTAGRAPGRP